MGAIFSKKKAPSRVTEQDKAILQLKHQRDQLKQYQKKIENKLESDRNLASKLLKNGQKERAKLLLRKKRYQENLLKNTLNQLENLEKLTQDLEYAQIEIEVVQGLKVGSEALKKLNDALKIEDIEKILEETQESIEIQNEISEMLGQNLTQEDEDDVELEFEKLISESLPLPEVPDENLPEVSKEKVKKEKTKEKVALEAS